MVKTVKRDPILVGIGEFTAHVRLPNLVDWDVHWGYELDFDPWPYGCDFFWGGAPPK